MRVVFRFLITSACLQLLWMVLIAKGQTDSLTDSRGESIMPACRIHCHQPVVDHRYYIP